jgi:hypothetical protein
MTDAFRGNTKVSRWWDPVWLGWLAVPLYWVHQFEKYSLPVIGLNYSLPDMVCKSLGFEPYPACPIPLPFYPLVHRSVVVWSAHRSKRPYRLSAGIAWPTDFASRSALPAHGARPCCLFRCPPRDRGPQRRAWRRSTQYALFTLGFSSLVIGSAGWSMP